MYPTNVRVPSDQPVQLCKMGTVVRWPDRLNRVGPASTINTCWPTLVRVSSRARRSDRTKSAILLAARERFAAEGYEKATIRAIASDAGIDPSMVLRYFGSKQGLFTAAARFDLQLPDLADTPPDQVGETLVRHFLQRWDDDETMVALLRAGVTNDGAVERLRGIFTSQLMPVVTAACPDPSEAPARAALVASQVLGLALCRHILRLYPIAEMPTDVLILWLGRTIQAYLCGVEPAHPDTMSRSLGWP